MPATIGWPWLKRDPIADLELQHLAVRTHLV